MRKNNKNLRDIVAYILKKKTNINFTFFRYLHINMKLKEKI